jgi:hypothetical protein
MHFLCFFLRQHNTCLLSNTKYRQSYLSFSLYYMKYKKELFNTYIIYLHFICIVKFLYILCAIDIHIIYLLICICEKINIRDTLLTEVQELIVKKNFKLSNLQSCRISFQFIERNKKTVKFPSRISY